jgi:hypothetical protein
LLEDKFICITETETYIARIRKYYRLSTYEAYKTAKEVMNED